jgi:hypothetical protein
LCFSGWGVKVILQKFLTICSQLSLTKNIMMRFTQKLPKRKRGTRQCN